MVSEALQKPPRAPVRFGARRGSFVEVSRSGGPLSPPEVALFEGLDLVYRSLCAMLYNYVPTSGHPGGSISSGRFVELLLFGGMEYDLSQPLREDADVISYAAGHKAQGLYALWALRNEIARIAAAARDANGFASFMKEGRQPW